MKLLNITLVHHTLKLLKKCHQTEYFKNTLYTMSKASCLIDQVNENVNQVNEKCHEMILISDETINRKNNGIKHVSLRPDQNLRLCETRK